MGRNRPEPFGFGNCGSSGGPLCPYYRQGTAEDCWECAVPDITRPSDSQCETCTRPPTSGSTSCSNWLCGQSTDRHFGRVESLGFDMGQLAQVIRRYKEKHGWGTVLGRLLVGWLDERWPDSEKWNLIVGMPHAENESGRGFDPMMKVLQVADIHSTGSYQFDADQDAPVLVKRWATPRMRDTGSLWERKRVAEEDLYPALFVRLPTRVQGQRVLVVDDMFTTGHSLNQVARRLREAGAVNVDAFVFARHT